MDQLVLWASVALFILVILSATFSATETAYTGANKIKLKKAAEDGNKKARKALRLLENYDRLLTTILVGNNLVNILASSLCTFIFTQKFGSIGVAYATAFMLIVILAVGEITPKSLAKANAERFAIRMSGPLSIIIKIFLPITWVFERFTGSVAKHTPSDSENSPTLTEEELRIMVDEIEEEGEIETAESDLIKSAMEFDDKSVSEILTPRVDIVAVDKTATMDELKEVFLHSGYSRIPVYNETIDTIVGVVYSKDFYTKYFQAEKDQRIGDLIRRVRFIPESTTVAKALSEIQRSSVQMLVVIDDYGGTVGIVALEDVLEELVGEIWDESDKVELDIVRDTDGGYTVLGDANINDLMEVLERKFDLEEYDGSTVGGFIQYKLQKMPITGDKLVVEGITMIVTSVRNRRVKLVKVIAEEPEASE